MEIHKGLRTHIIQCERKPQSASFRHSGTGFADETVITDVESRVHPNPLKAGLLTPRKQHNFNLNDGDDPTSAASHHHREP